MRDSPRLEPPLAADSIEKWFGRRRVLSAATLAPAAGRVTALLGRNGSGKSTLIRIVTGQLRADHGHVRIDGRIVERPRLHQLAKLGVFHLPAEPLLSRAWTVRQHMALVRRRFRPSDCDWLETLRLEALLDATSSKLSTGERRRAELCIALLRAPRVLLCDEPLHSISPIDAEMMADALREYARSSGAAVLVTGHEATQLLDVADDVVWLSAGTTIGLGSADAARRHGQFCREYLGAPAGLERR